MTFLGLHRKTGKVSPTPTLPPGPVEVTETVGDLTILIGLIPKLASQFAQFLCFAPGVSSSLNQRAVVIPFHIPSMG